MNKDESFRLHEDWWGMCRTCVFWSASDAERIAMTPAICLSSKSPLSWQETWTEGDCDCWDSFDLDAAIAVLEMRGA